MTSLTVKAFHDFALLEPLAESLLQLNLSSRRPSALDTLEYLRIAWENEEFSVKGRKPLLLTAFDGPSLIGFLPLRRSPGDMFGAGGAVVEFCLTHDNDRLRIVSRSEDETRCAVAFYTYLFAAGSHVSVMNFTEQDGDSKLFPVPIPLPSRYILRTLPHHEHGTVVLPPTLREYMASLSGNARRGFRKQCRRALATHGLTWVGSDEPAAARALLEIYLDVEKGMWKEKVGGIIGRSATRKAFFQAEMSDGLPFDLFVHLVFFRGIPIGGTIGGHFAHTTWLKETGYDEAFRDLAPGNLIMMTMIARAIERGSAEFNMLRDQGYYKTRWGAVMASTQMVQIYPRRSFRNVKATLGTLGRRMGLLSRPSSAPPDHNPARLSVTEGEDTPTSFPDRSAEAAHAAEVLAGIRRQGLRMTEYSASALLRYLELDGPETKQAGIS